MNFKKIKPLFYFVAVSSVFVLSFSGYHNALGKDFNFWDVLFSIISLFLLKYSVYAPPKTFTETNILIAKYIALTVISVGLFSVFFNRLKESWKLFSIKFFVNNHIIVFSLDAIGHHISKALLKNGYKVIVVTKNEKSPFIEEIENLGGLIIIGNPFEMATYQKIGLLKSRACILLSDDDETNLEIAGNISQALQQFKTNTLFTNRGVIKLLIQIKDHQNKNVVRDYFDVDSSISHFDLRIINFDQMAAQSMYDEFPPHAFFNANSIDENAIVIIGTDKTAESFILENIILSHYQNHKPLTIFLLDKNVQQFYDEFNFQYPFHKMFVNLVPIKLLNANFYKTFVSDQSYIKTLAKVGVAYIFGENDANVINTASAFRQFLYANVDSNKHTPIIVSLPEKTSIFNLLNEGGTSKNNLKNLFSEQFNHFFIRRKSDVFTAKSIVEEGETIDMISRVINFYYTVCYEFSNLIKVNHQIEVNYEVISELSNYILNYPALNDQFTEAAFENDFLVFMSNLTKIPVSSLNKWATIKKNWNKLNIRKKESNRYAARHIQVKTYVLNLIGCTPVNSENIIKFYPQLAKLEHYRWESEKMVFTYQLGDLSKNKAQKSLVKEMLKIHDQLIPYEDLTEEEKYKDLNLFLLLPLVIKLKNSLKNY